MAPLRHTLLLLAACLLALQGCTSADDDPAGSGATDDTVEETRDTDTDTDTTDDESDTPDSSDGLVTGDEFSVTGALSEIPESELENGMIISTADLASIRRVLGIDANSTDDDMDEVLEWLVPIWGGRPSAQEPSLVFVFLPYRHTSVLESFEGQREGVGFSPIDADAFVATERILGGDGESDGADTTVFAGAFDETTLDSDLAEVAPGVISDSEAEDGTADPNNWLLFDLVRRPTRFAFRDGKMLMSESTPAAETWLAPTEASAADQADYTAAADALDQRDSLSAVIIDVPEITAEVDPVGDRPQPGPFTLTGVGWGISDDNEPELTVVYVYADDETAAAAVESVEQAYRDGTTYFDEEPYTDFFDLTDVNADGRVVTASLVPSPDARLDEIFTMATRRESIFAR